MNLEKFVKSSFKRLPKEIKEKMVNISFTIEDECVNYKEARASHARYGDMCKIVFYKKPIERDIQKGIDKLMIHELAHYFGFNEEDAERLMEEKEL